MKIKSCIRCPYERDYMKQIINMSVELEEGETISVNGMISIEMMNGSFLETKVKLINPGNIDDYKWIDLTKHERAWMHKYEKNFNPTETAEGPCEAEIVIKGVPYHDIRTDAEIAGRKLMKEMWDNRKQDRKKYAIIAYNNKGYYKAIGRYCDADGNNAIYRIYDDRRYYGEDYYDLNEASRCIEQFAWEGKSDRILYDTIRNVPYTGEKWIPEVIKWNLGGGPLPTSKTDRDLSKMINGIISRGGRPDPYDQAFERGYEAGYEDGIRNR